LTFVSFKLFSRQLPMPGATMLRLPVLFALPILLGGCFERPVASVENAVMPVQVVRVALAPSSETRAYAGVIRPRREADIGFKVGGRLIERLVDSGAVVQAGAVLARLDPVDLALSVRSADADLAGAEAVAAQAVADANRSKTLAGQGWQSAAADDLKQATARSATQRVETARTALALARNRVDDAVLRAPEAGVVTAIIADPGTMMAAGSPVLRIASLDALEVEVQLPETALAALDQDQAEASFWARSNTTIGAKLREVSATADPKLRSYTARFTLTARPAWLALGMTATLRLASADAGSLALLPRSAVTDRGQGAMVWVVDSAGKLEARPVKVASLRQDRALVSGLKAGELVVGMGVQKLDPAVLVRIADIRPLAE
jgi:multidrug efflux system membrane fusion protein